MRSKARHVVRAGSLDEAEQKANKKYPKWVSIYEGSYFEYTKTYRQRK